MRSSTRLALITVSEVCRTFSGAWPIRRRGRLQSGSRSTSHSCRSRWRIPEPGEEQQGGHEVLCLGYDQTKQLALIQNSWGNGWGQRGYFWMPFEVIGSPDTDLWMVHTGGPWK